MMSICKARRVFLSVMSVAAAAMAMPAFAQEGSDPLVPSQPASAAAPATPTPSAQPAQTTPSPPPKPAPAQQAAAPAARQATGSIARQAAPVRRGPARLALAVANVNLRSAPGTNAEIVTTIPGGSTVRLTGCTGEWCAVTWHGRGGFAIARAFDSGDARQARYDRAPPPDVDDEDVVEAGPPVVYAPPPRVVYGPRHYYGPRYYYGPRWRYGW